MPLTGLLPDPRLTRHWHPRAKIYGAPETLNGSPSQKQR